jgi:predicted Zn-dependent peptidase
VVFREFYKERDVVREERRMEIESSPQRKLIEAALNTAFAAHPYGVPGVGWASDIENFRVPEAKEFFKTYYGPANLTIAIAGDVQPAEAKRLAEKYFGPMPAGPRPPLVRTVEPEQPGEKRVEVESAAQPFLLLAYKRPDQYSPDDPVLDVLASLLSSGRTGTLYKDLVSDRKIALAAQAISSFPASKYPTLFLFFLVPNQGHAVEELEKATYEIIERLRSQPVEQAALDRVKIKLRASLIRQLASNSGMAGQLASYHANYGDWRKLFTGLDEINKVTAEDVQRVARTYFIDRSKTVAYTAKPKTDEVEGSR